MSGLSVDRGGILKLLWSLGIDYKELISPASYVAWRARFLAPINCSKILAQILLPGWAMHGLFFTFKRIKENLRKNGKVVFVIPTQRGNVDFFCSIVQRGKQLHLYTIHSNIPTSSQLISAATHSEPDDDNLDSIPCGVMYSFCSGSNNFENYNFCLL